MCAWGAQKTRVPLNESATDTESERERDRGIESHRTQDTQNEGYQKITKQRALGDKPQKPTTM